MVRTSLVANRSLMPSAILERAGGARLEARIRLLRHRERLVGRLQHKGVERARLRHGGKMRLGELDGGHVPLAQAIAHPRASEMWDRSFVGAVADEAFVLERRACRAAAAYPCAGSPATRSPWLPNPLRSRPAAIPRAPDPAHQTRKKYSCSSQARHMGRPWSRLVSQIVPDPLFHALGTRKKWPSVAGAFLTISSGIPPSVTTSGRFFIAIGVTDVIDSPRDVDLRQLLDESEDGVELAPKVLDLLLGGRNAGQVRDAADGCGVDGHGASQFGRRAAGL